MVQHSHPSQNDITTLIKRWIQHVADHVPSFRELQLTVVGLSYLRRNSFKDTFKLFSILSCHCGSTSLNWIFILQGILSSGIHCNMLWGNIDLTLWSGVTLKAANLTKIYVTIFFPDLVFYSFQVLFPLPWLI